mmetsp:Transcript_39583/g.64188  ORF Transcript_39583/g.64188 Transcript_39583/m.64188 type:complete len:115 (-) Transcript_39583:659-1003(-)
MHTKNLRWDCEIEPLSTRLWFLPSKLVIWLTEERTNLRVCGYCVCVCCLIGKMTSCSEFDPPTAPYHLYDSCIGSDSVQVSVNHFLGKAQSTDSHLSNSIPTERETQAQVIGVL